MEIFHLRFCRFCLVLCACVCVLSCVVWCSLCCDHLYRHVLSLCFLLYIGDLLCLVSSWTPWLSSDCVVVLCCLMNALWLSCVVSWMPCDCLVLSWDFHVFLPCLSCLGISLPCLLVLSCDCLALSRDCPPFRLSCFCFVFGLVTFWRNDLPFVCLVFFFLSCYF